MKVLKLILIALFVVGSLSAFVSYDAIRYEIAKRSEDYPTLIRLSAKSHGVPLALAMASYDEESRRRFDSYRFEPGQIEIGRRTAKEQKVPGFELENQARMYSSSHCPCQVMGYHAPKYGLSSWLELYKPENCVEVSMSEHRKCLDAAKKKFKESREIFRAEERCYNAGSVTDMDGQKHALKVENAMIEEFFKSL